MRLRIGDRLYERRARRVTDQAEWALVGRALFAKYELEFDPEAAHGWLFRLDPR